MTYKELYDKALWDLEHNNMTLGEFEEVTEPLNKEISKEEQTDEKSAPDFREPNSLMREKRPAS